jgi:hypothetical protein
MHHALIAALLFAAPVAAPAAQTVSAAEKSARAHCRAETRGWDIKLPSGACQDPQSRAIAIAKARALCEKERSNASGAIRARGCPGSDNR